MAETIFNRGYRISSDNPIMLDLGLESFDAISLYEVMIAERNLTNPTNAFTTLGDSNASNADWQLDCQSIFDEAKPEPLKVWDIQDQKYTTKSVSSYSSSVGSTNPLADLAKLADKIQKDGFASLNDNEKELFYDVEALDGAVFKIDLEFLFGSANGVNCVKEDEIELTFRFLVKGKGNINKNVQAVLSEVPVAMIPVDKFGRTGFYTNFGDIKKPREGGITNPNNVEVARRDEVFDHAEGKVSGGTHQAIFILTEDCAAPELNSIDIENIDSLNNVDISSDVLDQNYFGGHTFAYGIPLSVFDGNPSTFGPLLLREQIDSLDKYKQILVNRGYRSFSAGQRVVCSKIDGEWLLPMEPDAAGESTKPFRIEKWGPVTYMTSTTDGYFRDSSYASGGASNTIWTHNHYENAYRDQFYASDTLNVAGSTEFLPSDQYWQYTSFDMVDQSYGGVNDNTLLGASNPHKDSLGNPRDITDGRFWDTLPFSGLLSTDGYNNSSVEELESKSETVAVGIDSDKYLTSSTSTFQPDINTNGDIASFSSGSVSFNTNAHHLPLDLALNASLNGENGAPILKLADVKTYLSDTIPTNSQFDQYTTQLLGSTPSGIPNRYVWCEDSNGEDFYDLKMVSNNKVTFLPLTGDVITSPDTFNIGDIQEYFDLPATLFDSDFMSREGLTTVIPYGSHVQNTSSNPYSNNSLSSTPWPTEGSYNVGITTTKVTISTTALSLNFTGTQSLGVPQAATVTGGSVGPISVIGGLIISGFGSDSLSNKSPQWGTNSDAIWDFNTSVLYARVFDYWPDEQTIFDPRYFSVMHFNPGQIYSVAEEVQYLGDRENPHGVNLFPTSYNPDDSTSVYYVDKEEFDVDFRVPTAHDKTNVFTGALVYSDYPMRRKEHWNIDTRRRGKLLPYKWEKTTISVNEVYIDPAEIGSGYAVGDTFETSGAHGSDAVIVVDSVNGDGGITAVSILSGGEGYDVQDFLASDYLTNFEENLTLSPKNVQSGSSGAVIHLASGVVSVIDEVFEDEGPVEHAEPTRISLPSRGGAAGENGIAEGAFEVPISIQTNDTNKYDVFLHFHNDTSYTIGEDISFVPAFLQYLDLQITPGVV